MKVTKLISDGHLKPRKVWEQLCRVVFFPSSETQGQIVEARESLRGRKSMARRKVKNGEKSPWGQCLTRPMSYSSRRSLLFFVPYFSSRLDILSPPLSAPGSPRMFSSGSIPRIVLSSVFNLRAQCSHWKQNHLQATLLGELQLLTHLLWFKVNVEIIYLSF